MSSTLQTDSEILSAIDELRLSAKKSVPWTLGAAVLTIAAFLFAAWTVWDSNIKIRAREQKNSELERSLAAEQAKVENLTGMLRDLRTAGNLPATAQVQVEAALQNARVISAGLAEVSTEAQQNAAAIAQITNGQSGNNGPALVTETVSRGRPNGWDIDIFWCTNAADPVIATANRDAAREDAGRLQSPGRLADGSVVGRVRVRPLSESLQRPYYVEAGSGRTIKPDRSEAEQAAGQAIVTLLGGGDTGYKTVNSGQVTRWYISMFVCG